MPDLDWRGFGFRMLCSFRVEGLGFRVFGWGLRASGMRCGVRFDCFSQGPSTRHNSPMRVQVLVWLVGSGGVSK